MRDLSWFSIPGEAVLALATLIVYTSLSQVQVADSINHRDRGCKDQSM